MSAECVYYYYIIIIIYIYIYISVSAVIVPLYKGEGERNKCKNYRSMVRKIYARILIHRVRRVTGGLIDFVFYYGSTSICDPMVDTLFI